MNYLKAYSRKSQLLVTLKEEAIDNTIIKNSSLKDC